MHSGLDQSREAETRNSLWSNEAEQAVLGAMLLDDEAAHQAIKLLEPSAFYREAHRLLFGAMQRLLARESPVDPVLLREELKANGDLERAGGMEYVGALIDVVPTAANITHHAEIVRQLATRREVVRITASLQDLSLRPEELIALLDKVQELKSGLLPENQALPGAPITVRLSDVPLERVEWLWKHRLARGKVGLLEGDPDLGKSTVTTDLAARITKGRTFPDGSAGVQGNVLFLTAEDGLGDTVRARIEAAGGDAQKVFVLTGVAGVRGEEEDPVFPQDMRALKCAIEEHQIVLVVVDPFVAYLTDKTNSWSDHSVRRAIKPFARLATETGVSILLIRHFRKSPGGSAIHQGGGSIAFSAAVRVGLMIAYDPEDGTKQYRILAVHKHNLTAAVPSLRFRLEAAPLIGAEAARIIWDRQPSPYGPDALVGAPLSQEDRDALEECKAVLSDLIPCPADDAMKAVKRFTDYTVRKAKSQLRIKSVKVGGRGDKKAHWEWVYERASASSFLQNMDYHKPHEHTSYEDADEDAESASSTGKSASSNDASTLGLFELHQVEESKNLTRIPPPDAGPPCDRFAGPLTPDEYEVWTERVSILLSDGFSEPEAENAAWAEVSERRAADPESYYR